VAQAPLQLDRYDSKGQNEEALSALRAAMDDGARIVLQGNSSATASALVDAIDKNNERDPSRRVIFLNYAAVDPALTNERCSFWHFRFDAHADMRVAALMDAVKDDAALKRVYLIGQDYSFGQAVLREVAPAARRAAARRGDRRRRTASDGQGEGLRALRHQDHRERRAGGVHRQLGQRPHAAREGRARSGFQRQFYTFYGNALGAPAAIGDAGIGRVMAVADWLPNVQTSQSEAFYRAFRTRFPKPADDYVHMRLQLMIESLVQAAERAGSVDAVAVARALEQADVSLYGQRGRMRATDHQFQQQLVVGVMDRQGKPGVQFDVEGSGYGFRVIKTIAPERAELPTSCKMKRP
jgi:branched-chain amino acid transport system substrate-binding protein